MGLGSVSASEDVIGDPPRHGHPATDLIAVYQDKGVEKVYAKAGSVCSIYSC